jgi:hypothetical protein
MTLAVGVKSVGHTSALEQNTREFADNARTSIRRSYCPRWLTTRSPRDFHRARHDRPATGLPKSRTTDRRRPCRLDDPVSQTTPQRNRDRITQRT